MATESLTVPRYAPLAYTERVVIEAALSDWGGNRTRAARQLGISLRTLQRKLKAWEKEDRRQR